MPEQLSLDLPRRTALGREDFFVSGVNQRAMTMLDDWHVWDVPRLALVGPKGSGKSHLSRVWAADSSASIVDFSDLVALEQNGFDPSCALVVEDADRMELLDPEEATTTERALLHIHNALGEANTPLLITGREAPARWAIALPDLASRLLAMPLARIDAPDSTLLEVLLVKFFADCQVHVAPDVVAYLAMRIERDGNSAERVVEALDRAAMRERRAITRPFAVDVLKQLGMVRATE